VTTKPGKRRDALRGYARFVGAAVASVPGAPARIDPTDDAFVI